MGSTLLSHSFISTRPLADLGARSALYYNACSSLGLCDVYDAALL